MEITDIQSFLAYYAKIRERSKRVIAVVPPDKIDFTYKEGKFTIADVIRHIAAIERYMFAETIAGRPSCYKGCDKELADGYDNILAYFDQMHQESWEIFSQLSPEDLQRKCITPGGASMPIWKWLRAMVEHEIHHRAQIYIYLNLLNVKTK